MENISRREFLQLAGLLGLGLSLPSFSRVPIGGQKKNILIIVYDAWSGLHLSMLGYQRDTMPYLSEYTDRAIVYHNHYSAANYTTPGTASLLTGVYPWTHRAFNLNETVIPEYLTKNIFYNFPDYYRFVYSHNNLVNTLLHQFAESIDNLIPKDLLFFFNNKLVDSLLGGDSDAAQIGWERAFGGSKYGHNYSLFFPRLIEYVYNFYRDKKLAPYREIHNDSLPRIESGSYFLLEHASDYLMDLLDVSPQPFLGYFHFFPPHDPYAPPDAYQGRFYEDQYQPAEKPEHFFTQNIPSRSLLVNRQRYDEYLLYVDREFGRVCRHLNDTGMLDDTWIILTSDHGELFERGILGHITPVLNQPVVRVPLIIFEPGRKTRMDIHQPTSAIDILPTLLHVSGKELPDWCEGMVLPPFDQAGQAFERSLYSMQLRYNPKMGALNQGSIALVKEPYKMIYYYGYGDLDDQGGELIELYDNQNDKEELTNLYPQSEVAGEFMDEIKATLEKINQRF